ncbi:MAG: SapC family protein [Immundisolibacteraceae bacterium]|nr:SapC family protein [Immundisolibacteraceae bacterium]
MFSKPVLLDAKAHQDWRIKRAPDFSFSRNLRFLPVTLTEFAQVALEQPLVFIEDSDLIVPVSVIGLNEDNNLFIDESGSWNGRYLPAYVRMYPFILAPRSDGNGYAVCVDADYPGLAAGKGEALFDDEGEQTSVTKNAIAFATEYQRQREESVAFTALLKRYGLLEPASVNVTTGEDEVITVGGFLTVNRDRLTKLKSESVLTLHALEQLEPIYLQLASLTNFEALSRRLIARRLARL